MIPSAKSRWFTAWFERQAYGQIRRQFGVIALAGREHLEAALGRGSVLAVSNHSAWWDPLVVLVLTHRMVAAEGYAMMDAANLRRLPFFAKIGAFGVDRGSRRDGVEALLHAESLLEGPRRLVWIFAQGQERPLHEPLQFLGGTARLAMRNPGTTVLPVAISYAFGAEPAPAIHVAVGPRVDAERSIAHTRDRQVEAVRTQLERIQREQSRPGTEGFVRHPLRRPGWLARVAERGLASLVRPFVPGLDPSRALPALRSVKKR